MTKTSLLNGPTPALIAAGRTLAEPRVSPDGTFVVVHSREGALTRLVRIDLRSTSEGAAGGPERVLTADPAIVGVFPTGGGSWCFTRDGGSIIYVARTGLFQIPVTGGIGELVLASIEGEHFSCPVAGPNGQVAVLVESDVGHEIRICTRSSVDRDVTTPATIASADPLVFRGDLDWGVDQPQPTWHEWRVPFMPWDASTFGGASPVPTAAAVSVGQPRWSPAGKRFGYLSDAPGWLVVHVDGNPVVNEQHEHATPTWGVGQRSWCWMPDEASVAFCRNEEGYARLCLADVATGAVHELGKAWHRGLSAAVTAEGTVRIAAIRSGGVTPPQLVVYESAAGSAANSDFVRTTVAHSVTGGWDRFTWNEPQVVSWLGDDGTPLHGRLYLPTSPPAGRLKPPVIVSIHGGPTDQSVVEFNPRFIRWLTSGWAVFVPDYRGSTGHGRAYQQAMNRRWGERDVTDIASGLDWLRSSELVDRDAIVLMGGSAGGYSILHLLTRPPEVLAGVRGAVVLYPVVDLGELEAHTHRFEKHYNAILVGGPELYAEWSPLTHVARIHTPMLLMHGDADEVVNVEQSRSLVRELTKQGTPVEYVEYAGEGHGWRKPETRANEIERIDTFLRNALANR